MHLLNHLHAAVKLSPSTTFDKGMQAYTCSSWSAIIDDAKAKLCTNSPLNSSSVHQPPTTHQQRCNRIPFLGHFKQLVLIAKESSYMRLCIMAVCSVFRLCAQKLLCSCTLSLAPKLQNPLLHGDAQEWALGAAAAARAAHAAHPQRMD